YYTMMMVIILGIVYLIQAVKDKTIADFSKASIALLIAAFIAVLPNITRLLVTYEYGEVTMRGKSELKAESEKSTGLEKSYAFRWSNGIAETMTILIPHYYGGASATNIGSDSELAQAFQKRGVSAAQAAQLTANAPTYWGKQPITSGPTYFGAGILFLFVLGLQLIRGPDKWWILITTILMTMLSWGNNFPALTDLFFDHYPAYNKFRAVSMMLTLPAFTVPLLAIMVLHRVFTEKLTFKDISKPLYISAGITGGLCLIFALMPSIAGDFKGASDAQLRELGWPVDALIADRKSMLSTDAFRSLFFILATAGAIWAYLNKKLKMQHALIAVGLLFLIDLWMVDKRYLNDDDFVDSQKVEVPYQPTQADQQILNDPDPHFRVFNVALDPFADASTSYFHKSLGGYHGAKLKRYQELIERHIGQNNMSVISMLNTKYFIVNAQGGGAPIAQMNRQAMGNAWFVQSHEIVEDPDAEIAALSDFDPAQTLFVDKRFESQIDPNYKYDSLATINLTEYKANHLTYQSNSRTEQLAVFSEVYYDLGWNAYIDGEQVPHFRGNYILRAMMIPAGEHKVEFKFEPSSYYTGEKIALAGSILLYLGFGGIMFLQVRSIKNDEPVEEVQEKPVKKRSKVKKKNTK
ncbi:MAG: YfhO family protein, partial [Bacteroidia bacterium]|nr:YfhO family protein [Bacteroidia bacterium]